MADSAGGRRWIAPAVAVAGGLAAIVALAVMFAVTLSRPRDAPTLPPLDVTAADEQARSGAVAPRSDCLECGTIESIRRIDGPEGAPAQYTFVVRMHDGSRRESRETTQGRWLVGDRLRLIGGDAPKGNGP